MASVKCPHCKTPVPWTPESRYRPFCSERCRLIDLGDWFEGRNHIPGPDIQLGEGIDELPYPLDPANED